MTSKAELTVPARLAGARLSSAPVSAWRFNSPVSASCVARKVELAASQIEIVQRTGVVVGQRVEAHQVDRLPGEHLERLDLPLLERARDPVEHAQRTDGSDRSGSPA